MKKVENIADLRLEIKRLQVQAGAQEKAISNDIRELHAMLSPGHIIKNAFGSIVNQKFDTGSILKGGVNFGVSFLIEKLLFRNSSPILRNVVSFIASRMASGAVSSSDSEGIVEKVKDYISNLFGKKKDSYFDSTYQEREIYGNDY